MEARIVTEDIAVGTTVPIASLAILGGLLLWFVHRRKKERRRQIDARGSGNMHPLESTGAATRWLETTFSTTLQKPPAADLHPSLPEIRLSPTTDGFTSFFRHSHSESDLPSGSAQSRSTGHGSPRPTAYTRYRKDIQAIELSNGTHESSGEEADRRSVQRDEAFTVREV